MQKFDNVTAIVLCGGLGTRLRSVNAELPKPMVGVAGRPFLEYILDYLIKQGITQAVLAVSYKKERIIDHFGHRYKSLNLTYSIESSPLGTGGAIKQAIEQCANNEDFVLVINGDTLVEYDLQDMYSKLSQENANFVMSVKNIDDTDRYGRVTVENNKITAFEEKRSGQLGFINTGAYLLRSHLRQDFPHSLSFSFEKDYLEKEIQSNNFLYSISDGYFIDIGIPKDYHQAQVDLSKNEMEFII